MAQSKTVYTVEFFKLIDGTEVEVKPLPIKRLRLAQDKINNALAGVDVMDEDGNPVLNDDGTPLKKGSEELIWDSFLDVVELTMKGQAKCEKFLDEETGRELLEDTIDQDTMYEIVRVSTGFDFLAMTQKMEKLAAEMGETL